LASGLRLIIRQVKASGYQTRIDYLLLTVGFVKQALNLHIQVFAKVCQNKRSSSTVNLNGFPDLLRKSRQSALGCSSGAGLFFRKQASYLRVSIVSDL
jgi:hypothetical protein